MIGTHNNLIEIKRLEGRRNDFLSDAEVVFVCEGHIIFEYANGETETLQERMFVLLAPESDIRYRCTAETLVIVCRPSRLGESLDFLLQNHMRLPALEFNDGITHFTEGLIAVLKDGIRDHTYTKAKLKELVSLLQFYYTDKFGTLLEPHLYTDVCFIEKVFRNIHHCQTVKELAELCHLSESGFYKKFEGIFQQSPSKFLTEQKKKKIYNALVYGDQDIAEISDAFGFSTVSNFGRFCRVNFGVTPTEMRKSALTVTKPCAFTDWD